MSHEQAKDVRLTNTKYLQIMWEDRNRTDLISNIYAKRGGGIKKQIPVLAVEDVWQTFGGHVCKVHGEPSANT